MKNVVRQMFCISKLTLVIDLPILIHSIHDLILHAFVFNLDLFLDLRVRVYFSCLLIYCFLLAALTTFLDDDLFNAQASLNAKITLWVVFYQLGNRLSLGSLVSNPNSLKKSSIECSTRPFAKSISVSLPAMNRSALASFHLPFFSSAGFLRFCLLHDHLDNPLSELLGFND